jgi:hypothetical protein
MHLRAPLTSEKCVVASHPAFPYLVPARRFLAWWQRLSELDAQLPEYMSEFEWLSRGQKIRSLLADVGEVGRAAGALTPYVRHNPDGSVVVGDRPNPDFDWEHGEIDLQASEYHGNDGIDRAPGLVARLVKVTGIPES